MVAIYTVFYNLTKIDRTMPAMAAALTDRLWDMAEIVALIEHAETPIRISG